MQAIDKLCLLLEGQGEHEAIVDLNKAKDLLKTNDQKAAIAIIIDAFEGDHELMAYTMQREGQQWTEVEELSQASSRVLSLARRIRV
ncbi:hypothetical protein [Pseudobacteriovorax antillogorgiicola]|nr:hypothetical protein [Pseudobacteriovorax antillogorgiicola]